MNYTFFAIGAYILMRGVQTLFQGQEKKKWYRILITAVTAVVIYAALASLIVWYKEIRFLGFDPSK